ncbi:class I SAM-dependent methyltransferase [Phycisphaerales bacterium AB-hyl4]|uniref:Class I SAM-dependent methyltransferase n=1 Tax=Natronomicrosphaera hydrolytica TaxID=3242702 RepID=A0ABV4U0K5_9BACT
MAQLPPIHVETVSLSNRNARADHIVRRYGKALTGRVLDVGCDMKRIKKLRPELDYLGIDIGGEPDMQVDLQAAGKLPFDDKSFDTIVCTDVLEHLDNLHQIFAELVRVSRGKVVLSLPNCWYTFRQPIRKGRGEIRHYGLPAEPPADRHRWVFNVEDIARFLTDKQDPLGYRIAEMSASVNPGAKNTLRRFIWPKRAFLNRYAHTLWAVLDTSG